MFSFKTADTKESICNNTTAYCQTVYLLQPGNLPIKEVSYQGYGVFGDNVDVYTWLAEKNVGVTNRLVGLTLYRGELLYLAENNFALHVTDKDVQAILKKFLTPIYGNIRFFSKWNETLHSINKTPNDLLDNNLGKNIKLRDEIKFPLKFSFNENAQYEEFKRSDYCPFQGLVFLDKESMNNFNLIFDNLPL
jgi:hypothetical protein